MSKKLELSGQRFGKLTAIEKAYSNEQQRIVWKCRCDCGNDYYCIGSLLKIGVIKSCGCGQKEAMARMVADRTKHGLSHEPLYQLWKSMRSRCNTVTEKCYPNYGGRGIKVCDEWNDFKNYYDWAIANGWRKGLSIDRIDNNKGYSPDNCRIVTMKDQVRNRRKTVYLEYNGERKPLTEWCEIYGLNIKTCYGRLHDYKWTNPQEILFGKVRKNA